MTSVALGFIFQWKYNKISYDPSELACICHHKWPFMKVRGLMTRVGVFMCVQMQRGGGLDISA